MKAFKGCDADLLEALIAATPDGGTCTLDRREYYITRRVEIHGKREITLDGNNAEIVTRYFNNAHYSKSSELFLIEDCEGVTVCNIIADTDTPVNASATVEQVDIEGSFCVLRVDGCFDMRGDELIMCIDSVDGEGSLDWRLHHYFLHPDPTVVTCIENEILLANTYWSAPYDYLGENRFRVYFPKEENKLVYAFAGQRVCIRHTDKGPGAIVLRNSNRTALKNITLHSVPGMAVIVLPKCTDLTVERLRVTPKEGSASYLACNSDGIHLAGLGGTLRVKDCYFNGMGDDALNVHSTMGTVTEVLDGGRFRCNYCKKSPDGELSAGWCREGDIIRVYDPADMELKAVLRVISFCQGVLSAEGVEGKVEKGYVLQNTAFAPDTYVSGCTVRNSVARGFIIQTDLCTIEDCNFFGIAGSVVKAAPDFEYWYEAGPTRDFLMKDNRIEKCAFTLNSPVIDIQTNHFEWVKEVKGLHKKIRIEGNAISRTNAVCVAVYSAETVDLKRNSFPKDISDPVNIHFCGSVEAE